MTRFLKHGVAIACIAAASPALAQPSDSVEVQALRLELQAARAQLEAQERRLQALEARMTAGALPTDGTAAAPVTVVTTPTDPITQSATIAPALERVGEAPVDLDRPPAVAVLGDQGSVLTRAGQLTAEAQFEYARADRNRALFRGIEIVESVLIGVFDINESRQDIVTGSAALRYGLTNRLEFGVRLPFVHRSDASIVAPISGSTNNDAAATIDSSVKASAIGDLELTARYQLTQGKGGWPYLIANVQAVVPTGSDPFEIPRDELGRPTRAATGAGFWGISPSITAILPSDPVVLFGTLGYTFNLGRGVDTRIPPVIIDYVDPGDAVSASAGIGISFNQRTTLNLGYAHSWAFGTRTRTSLIEPTAAWPGERETRSRDLQIGRLLFGVTYRVTDRTSLNWSVEVGATEDAADLRTVLRVPTILLTGR